MEAMRTIYSHNSILILFSDIEMVVDIPETEKITFTLVTNKKGKGKKRPKCLLSLFLTLRAKHCLFQGLSLFSRLELLV